MTDPLDRYKAWQSGEEDDVFEIADALSEEVERLFGQKHKLRLALHNLLPLVKQTIATARDLHEVFEAEQVLEATAE